MAGDNQDNQNMEFGALSSPTFVSATATADGRYLHVVFSTTDEPLLPVATHVPGFTIKRNGGGAEVVASALRKGPVGTDGITMVLTAPNRFVSTDTITVSYVSATPALTDNGGLVAANFTDQAVTNNTVERRPTFASATTDLTGTVVEVLLQDLDSSQIFPSVGIITTFTVEADAVSKTVVQATRKGSSGADAKTVVITLNSGSPILTGEVVTVSYVIGGNPVVDSEGNQLQAFTDNAVTNIVSEKVSPVFASASSSADGTKVEVVFTETTSPPLLPATDSVIGFTVTQGTSLGVVTAIRKGASGADGRTFVLTLNNRVTGSGDPGGGTAVTVSYAAPTNSVVITDSAAIPNQATNFTTQAVTNNTDERTAPAFVSATAAAAGGYIDVLLSETANTPLLPATGATGFSVKVNGATASISGSVDRVGAGDPDDKKFRINLSVSLNCEDVVTVSYTQSTGNVTDSETNPNELAAFTNQAVIMTAMTDNTAPAFSSAVTSDNGFHIFVVLKENRTPPIISLTSGTTFTGFYVHVNGIPREIVSVERKGASGTDAVTVDILLTERIYPGDDVQISYIAGTTDGVKDSSPANNAMASLAAQTVTNNTLTDPAYTFNGMFDVLQWVKNGSGTPPVGDLYERRYGYPLANVLIDTHAPDGEVVINENPSGGGIRVHQFAAYLPDDVETPANGGTLSDELFDKKYEAIKFTSSGRQDITHVSVKLKSAAAITNTAEEIIVRLYDDNAGEPGQQLAVATESIQFGDITTSYTEFKVPLVYAIGASGTVYWIVVSRISTPTSNIFIQTYNNAFSGQGYAASDDTTDWEVALSKRGVFKLYGLSGDATPASSYDELQDAFESPVRAVEEYGGSENEDIYEQIGTHEVRSVVKYLTKIDAEYPEIKSIEVGLTATKPKAYIVEVKNDLANDWQPVFYMLADKRSRDYIRYTFETAVSLAAVRIRYRGDFYAASNDSVLTVSASDPLTPVTGVQLSHYNDFDDAADIDGADSEGWLPFEEGTSLVDWSLINLDRIWQLQDDDSESLINAVRFSDGIVAYSAKKIYYFTPGGVLTFVHPSVALAAGVNIQCHKVHKNTLYIGLSDGRIVRSVNGTTWSDFMSSGTIASVTCLESYRNKLWIGTKSTESTLARIYSHDGTLLNPISKPFNEDMVSCMAVKGGYLFAGVSGRAGFATGSVYIYDGITWSETLNSDADGVDSLVYSTADQNIWTALRGGSFFSLAFGSDGKPTTWLRRFDGENTSTYSLSDDPNGEYLWLNTDRGTTAYIKDKNTFVALDAIPPTTVGLRGIWTKSTASDYRTLGLGTLQVFTQGTTNIPSGTMTIPSGITNEFNVVFEGYVVPTYSEIYTFTVNHICDGVKLYIDDTLVVSNWEIGITGSSTGSIALKASRASKIRVEMAGSTADTVTLEWESTSQASQDIPSSAFRMPSEATAIVYVGAVPYAVSLDQKLYLLDPSSIGIKTRTVYARFKDSVGNVTGTDPITGDITTSALISDEIIQDAERRNGVRVSDGRLYQVSPDKTIAATFVSSVAAQLRGPDRRMRQSGVFESEPFFAASLNRWDKISFIADLVAGAAEANGLDRGTQVDLYVRTGTSRNSTLAEGWGSAFSRTTIGDPGAAGTVNTATVGDFNISTIKNKWLQFKLVLSTASKLETPQVKSVTLSYKASQSSYFYTTMFDSANESDAAISPTFRRLLLTANSLVHDGSVEFGYTTDDTAGNTFDFAKYESITPNTVTELVTPSSKIRFGIKFISVMAAGLPTTIFPLSPVRAATTANITLSGPQTIDGVACVAGNRILVKNQTTGSQNGIYVVAAGAWARSTDADAVGEIVNGTMVSVQEGDTNARRSFVVTTANVITIGVTTITFAEFTVAIVDDFAVQLDAGNDDDEQSDMKFMD